MIYLFVNVVKQISIFLHLSTQNGNPICCSTAIETINQLKDNNFSLLQHVDEMMSVLKSNLLYQIGNHPNVFVIKGKGLMLSIDLVESKITGELLSFERLILFSDHL